QAGEPGRSLRDSRPSYPTHQTYLAHPTRMIQSVRRFIAQHDLIPRGARVLAAVSGGSDSVALAHLLRELDGDGDLQLAGIVHFNHQLRPAADADEQFVRQLADTFRCVFVTDTADVAARARLERRSVEDAARAARYEGVERARPST